MARLRGRCAKGKRLRAGVPKGHWKTTTFVAGLRLTGMMAPMVLDGPMNRAAFLAASQVPTTQAFLYTAAHAAVWRKKPSYAVVASKDRFLHPDTQRMMYRRANAKTIEIASSHAVHVSNPEKVAALIERAAIENL